MLLGGVDILSFLETLSGVSVNNNKLYNNAPFSEANDGDGDGDGDDVSDDVKEDDDVVVIRRGAGYVLKVVEFNTEFIFVQV